MLDFLSKSHVVKQVDDTRVFVHINKRQYHKDLFLEDMNIMEMVNRGSLKFEHSHDISDYKLQTEVHENLRTRAEDSRKVGLVFNKNIAYMMKAGHSIKYDYEDFIKHSLNFLAQLTLYILKNTNLSVLLNKKSRYDVIYRLIDSMEKGYLAYQHEELSTANLVTLEVSGTFLVGRIYAPWKYTNKIDSSAVIKLLSHELVHQVQFENKYWSWYYKLKDKLEKYHEPGGEERDISALFEVYCLLHLEGTACFYEWQNYDSVSFDLDYTDKLVHDLKRMSNTMNGIEARKIYEEEFCPTGRSGEYYLGYLMCYIIGLSILKDKTEYIYVHNTKEQIKWKDLNKYILWQRKAKLQKLDADTFRKAYAEILKIKTHTRFMLEYMKACSKLGLKKPVMFLDTTLFEELNSRVVAHYKKMLKEKISS